MKFCNEKNLKRIDDYIKEHKEDIINDLIYLVRMPSVKGEAEENAPYGVECAKCLNTSAELFERNGFETKVNNECGYVISNYGNGTKSIGIFSHTDVVPVDENWHMCKPFEPVIKDGYIFGRGCEDDKSGIIQSLYAAKIIRDLGFDFKSRLDMFAGSNEETGMADIKSFSVNESMPDVSLIPDAMYPCLKGERSTLRFTVTSNSPVNMKKFYGGEAFNIVLGRLDTELPYSAELYEKLKAVSENNDRCEVCSDDNTIYITTKGISKHIMDAESTLNAGKVLAEVMLECDCDDRMIFEDMSKFLANGLGSGFGIEYDDAVFGKTVCANGIARLTEDNKIKLTFDCRFGIDCNVDEIKNKIIIACENRWDPEFSESSEGYFIEDNKIIGTLENVYEEISGIKGLKAETMAGGTYARHLKNAIPIGTSAHYLDTPISLPEGHGGVHQPDEKMCIDAFLEGLKILVCYIMELDSVINE